MKACELKVDPPIETYHVLGFDISIYESNISTYTKNYVVYADHPQGHCELIASRPDFKDPNLYQEILRYLERES